MNVAHRGAASRKGILIPSKYIQECHIKQTNSMRETRRRNVMETKPVDKLKYRKILLTENSVKFLCEFGLRCSKIQCAWSGFLSEVELVWRQMKVKIKRRCISEARKSGFVRVSKYEQEVNSEKVWQGLPPKFFANFSCEIRMGSNRGKDRLSMFAVKNVW